MQVSKIFEILNELMQAFQITRSKAEARLLF